MITGKLANIVGKRFGRLLVESIAGRNKQRQLMVKCLCGCGNHTIVLGYSLIYEATRSCGCLNREIHKRLSTTHNLSKTRFYRVWQGIKSRCNNPKDTAYKYYGGRGIIICPMWQQSFITFCFDTFLTYGKTLTIDRIDTNGPYCPFNVRWVEQAEQKRNSRQNKIVSINGIKRPLFAWLIYYGVKRSTYGQRVFCYGMTPQQALITPVRKYHKSLPHKD